MVCLEDHGVVLCGASEAGKSTTAAAFALRGVPILSEDIAALKEEQNGFYVQSGYPRISLWPDSVSHLFGNPESLPRILPDWEKRFLNLDDAKGMFEANRRALAAIYLIADRTEESHAPMIENVAAREALLELVQNTFMNYLLDREQRAGEFETLSKLVSRVPVRRVVPHADPSRIGAMCDAIERDTSRLLASAKSKT